MSALSHYTRAITSEVGDIERRLQAVQRGLEKLGGRASSNARDSADGLSEAVHLQCRTGRIASGGVQTRSPINLQLSAKMRPGTEPQR
jgi:hypothetical protein